MDKQIRILNLKVNDEDPSPSNSSIAPSTRKTTRRADERKVASEFVRPKLQPPPCAPEPTVNVIKPKFAGAFLKPAVYADTEDVPLSAPLANVQPAQKSQVDSPKEDYCQVVFGHSVIWHPPRHWTALNYHQSVGRSVFVHVIFLGLILMCAATAAKIMPEPHVDRVQVVTIELDAPGQKQQEPNAVAVAPRHEGTLAKLAPSPHVDPKPIVAKTLEPVPTPIVAHRANNRRTNSENIIAKKVIANASSTVQAPNNYTAAKHPLTANAAPHELATIATNTDRVDSAPESGNSESKPGSSQEPLLIASAGHTTGATAPYVSSATQSSAAALPAAQFARALTPSTLVHGALPSIYLSTPFQFSFADDGTQNRPLKYSSDWTMLEPSQMRSADLVRSEPHNEAALVEMENARKLEIAAIKAKNSGDEEHFASEHGEARKAAALALEHLKSHLQIIQNKQLPVSPVYTHYNMATCYALLGDTKNSLSSLQKYHACNPDNLTHRMMWGNYHIATVLMVEGDYAAARQLLRTVINKKESIDDVEWTNFALNWELIAESERLQGHEEESQNAHREGMRALYALGAGAPQAAGHMRDRLYKLGIFPAEYIIGAAATPKLQANGKILSVKPTGDVAALVHVNLGRTKGIQPGMQLYSGNTILHVVEATDAGCTAEYTLGPFDLAVGGQVRTRL